MRARFHRADNLRSPVLWTEVLERAAAAPSRRVPAWPSISPSFRLVLLLIALLVVAAAAIATTANSNVATSASPTLTVARDRDARPGGA